MIELLKRLHFMNLYVQAQWVVLLMQLLFKEGIQTRGLLLKFYMLPYILSN